LHCVFCLIFVLLFLGHLLEQGFLPWCPVGMLLFYVTNKFDWWLIEHKQTKQKKNTHKHALPPGLCGGNLLTMYRCHQRGLSSQSLGKYWQLNQSNQHTSTYSRIQQTKNPYYATIHNEYARENPRINRRTDRRSRCLLTNSKTNDQILWNTWT